MMIMFYYTAQLGPTCAMRLSNSFWFTSHAYLVDAYVMTNSSTYILSSYRYTDLWTMVMFSCPGYMATFTDLIRNDLYSEYSKCMMSSWYDFTIEFSSNISHTYSDPLSWYGYVFLRSRYSSRESPSPWSISPCIRGELYRDRCTTSGL